MRVCPKCGYVDPPYWRHVMYRLYTDYCHIDDLRIHKPNLARKIEKDHDVKVLDYIYHFIPKSNIVQRIHITDSRDGKGIREPEQEKHFKFVPLNQSRLLEEKEDTNP